MRSKIEPGPFNTCFNVRAAWEKQLLVLMLAHRPRIHLDNNSFYSDSAAIVHRSIQVKHAHLLIAILGFTFPVIALPAPPPDQVFSKLSKSIFVVEAYDRDDNAIAQGSGVVTGPFQITTNCHVVDGATKIGIRREGKRLNAELFATDSTRDLCILQVSDKIGPSLSVRESTTLKIGQRVYAIGAPLGLELSLSEGIISSLRKADHGFLIQTTTPISPGSSGGGLFDENGALIGITTFQTTKGQNLNFAVPAEWILSVPKRHARASELNEQLDQLSKRAFDLAEAMKWRELQQHAEKWKALYPNHLGGWYWLARANEGQNQIQEAMANYRHAVGADLYQNSDGAILWISYIHMAQLQRNGGQDADCGASYAEAMLLFPDKEIAGNMFHCFRRAGQFDRALEVYRQITVRHPSSEVGWEGLGGAYLNLKKPHAAKAAFEKLVTLYPNHVDGWRGLTLSALASGNKDAFMMAIGRLAAIAPDVANKILNDIEGISKPR